MLFEGGLAGLRCLEMLNERSRPFVDGGVEGWEG